MSETENGQSTGIVGTVINELHQFEQKVEGMLHGGGAPSSTEPPVDPNAGAPADALAPVEREAGAAMSGEYAAGAQAPATGTSTDVSPSSASTAMLASGSQAANSLNPSDAPAVAGLGEDSSSGLSLNPSSSAAPSTAGLGSITGETASVASSALGDVGNAVGSDATAMSASSAVASVDAGGAAADAGNVEAASGAIGGAPVAASLSAPTGLSSDQSDAATNGASGDDPNVGAIPASVKQRFAELSDARRELSAGTAVLAAAEESVSAAADALLARWHREMSLLGRGLSAETEKLIRETAAYLEI
ncbi:hypothetical protein QZN01_20880 [Burkholderia cenocepacia]|uniref:hypothetical protein n=1 Tax=Burkholderia cenocepacia TaxID=95486 RepID=UPI002650A36E|nr:hypothetical protein [Burkholderia cenocepacia]MDN7825110.1 hypothetical protein [Burkholderia cenocepacia]